MEEERPTSVTSVVTSGDVRNARVGVIVSVPRMEEDVMEVVLDVEEECEVGCTRCRRCRRCFSQA